MKTLRTAAIALFCGVAVTLAASAVANATSCPNASVGSSSVNRVYELSVTAGSSTISGCAIGDGNLNNIGADINTQGYIGTYPNPPAPTTGLGVSPIPAGATLQAQWDPAAGSNVVSNPNITINGSSTGGITFSSAFTNVFIGIKDGNQNPTWAVFYLGSVAAGTSLSWDYLTCNNVGQACVPASSAASGVMVWGLATPLPPAALLFGTALVGMGILGRRRRKNGQAVAA
jgi:hypothetical protein